ncbi:GNAT family N-acetyltransferase [Phycicoccus sp. BSK3Z-2]|uniref:GNAT family N-acetyltransferase n=1 Tax=Phycicoccus avicenniae TaxID=2828860 RepID=A0A941DE75_9MICO|nr:GNAT family N-acetyltransferase [Phycicoccus avicenniae]MBR7744687.1 GNAT family N-acetyltransferase [Phycicoccus avicenniae]
MDLTMSTPATADLRSVTDAVGGWQRDDGPLQLHPGDIGWYGRLGPAATAAALRVWRVGGRVVAVGLLDGDDLLRTAVDPHLGTDADLARRMAEDVDDPARGVLPSGEAVVEARGGPLLLAALKERGWVDDEPWTPLHRDLRDPVPGVDLRLEVVGPDTADDWVEVHLSAFHGDVVTDDDRRLVRDRFDTLTAGPFAADVTAVTGRDAAGAAVACAAVWTAGAGRPGLLEPMGVHDAHRGHGYGRSVCLAAAAVLRDAGASSALVCAETANTGAVATYEAAGFVAAEPVRDVRRAG